MDLLADSDGENSDNEGNKLKINKQYAKSYETWRKKEEKQKLIDKYGDVDSSSSSSEEEVTTTKGLDKEWLRAYSVVRFNQSRLHSGTKLFTEEIVPIVKKKEKVTTLKDHERKFILEKRGVLSDDENDDSLIQKKGKSYFEEQEDIKKSLKKAIEESDSEEKEDSLFVKKTKTKEEKIQDEKDQNDYLAWLKGEQDELEDKTAAEELAPLKEYWSNPNLTDKEKVLRDYILNNGYRDREKSNKYDDESDDDSEDDDAFNFEEEFLDQADDYEKTYNFRHEEPGGTEIKSYPRVIETSVRTKKQNRRAETRQRKREKKIKEKEQRMEDMKVLRSLQKVEKEEKLQKLQKESDIPDLKYNLDDDFDPEEHNRIMQKYFNDDYYQEGDSVTKPVFDPDDDKEFYGNEADEWWQSRSKELIEDEDQIKEHEEEYEEEELYADDPGFVMDVDYDPEKAERIRKSKKEEKRKKKKAKLEKLPLFDPTQKSFDEYLDEYLKDKINKLPFTYREVMPDDFGLTTKEILSAQDTELNSWIGVKRMSTYQTKQEDKQLYHSFKKRSKNLIKKYKAFPSLAPQTSSKSSEKKQKKKDEKVKVNSFSKEIDEGDTKLKKSKKRKLSSIGEKDGDTFDINDDAPPKEKKRNKEKKTQVELYEDGIKTFKKPLKESFDSVSKEESKISKKQKKKEKKIQDETDKDSPNTLTKSQDSENNLEDSKISKKQKKKEKKIQNETNEDSPNTLTKSQNSENNLEDSKISKKQKKKEKRIQDETQEDSTKTKPHELTSKREETSNTSKQQKKKEKKNKEEKWSVVSDERACDQTQSEQNNTSNRMGQNVVLKKKNKKGFRLKERKSEHKPSIDDKWKAKSDLRQVMSVSRLKVYGIEPGKIQEAHKLKRRKKINDGNKSF